MNWLNVFIPNLRSSEFSNSEPAARATWLSVLAYCCEQENGGTIASAESWGDRAWLQTCGVTRKEAQSAAPLIAFEMGHAIVWNYPEDKEKEVQAKRKAGKRGGLAKAAGKGLAGCATSSAIGTATSSAIGCAPTEGKGKEVERNEKEKEAEPAAPIDENEMPDLEAFCEYFSPNMKCLGHPVPLDDWLMETYSYYATTVWPKTGCRLWKKMFGKLIANYRSRHAQISGKTMPMRNGKPMKPINDF